MTKKRNSQVVKVNASVADRLEATANSLPKIQKAIVINEFTSGAKLIASGIKVINGIKVDRTAKYRLPYKKFQDVDHLREVKRIHLHHGWPGVVRYQRQVMEIYNGK